MRHFASTSCSLVCANSSSSCLSCSFSPSFSSSCGSEDVLSPPGDEVWRDPTELNRSLQFWQPITLFCMRGIKTHRFTATTLKLWLKKKEVRPSLCEERPAALCPVQHPDYHDVMLHRIIYPGPRRYPARPTERHTSITPIKDLIVQTWSSKVFCSLTQPWFSFGLGKCPNLHLKHTLH